MKKLVILGHGGYGRTVEDVAEQLGYTDIQFLDDAADAPCSDYVNFPKGAEIYPAFGNNEIRFKWIEKIEEAGYTVPTLIHPTAYVSPKAKVGNGCVVLPKAVVNTDVVLEKGCIINIGALVDHGCILEACCHLAPGAVVKGENRILQFTKVDSGGVVEARRLPI